MSVILTHKTSSNNQPRSLIYVFSLVINAPGADTTALAISLETILRGAEREGTSSSPKLFVILNI